MLKRFIAWIQKLIPRAVVEYDNIMLDLETVGTRPSCSIIAIGAVAFTTPKFSWFSFHKVSHVGETFYIEISRFSARRIGLIEDQATIDWWKQQSSNSRKIMDEDNPNGEDITIALMAFQDWLHKFGMDKIKVWGNGSDFDNAIINYAYVAAGFPGVPWKFYNNRCYRTLKSLPMAKGIKFERIGTHHNALDDAISQAVHALKILSDA
jgi:hypothetical protein